MKGNEVNYTVLSRSHLQHQHPNSQFSEGRNVGKKPQMICLDDQRENLRLRKSYNVAVRYGSFFQSLSSGMYQEMVAIAKVVPNE